MAFDIYAGTFVRFYTRDWENVVQKQARVNGTEYRMIYAGGDSGPPSEDDVRMAVDAWKQGINAALAQHNLGPIEWSEAGGQPYFTDRPSWEGYFAVQLWAAQLEQPELAVPYALPNSSEKSALTTALEKDDLHLRSIIQGGVWLPGDFDFLLKFPALTDGEVMIGSTARLLQELRELRSRPLRWGKKSVLPFMRKKDSVSFQECAEWSLSVFEGVVEQGHAAKLPFMLSF